MLEPDLSSWFVEPLQRIFPGSPAGRRRAITLSAARAERCSFQVGFRTADRPAEVTLVVEAPDDLQVTVRSVGYVPMRHSTGNVPAEFRDGIGHIPGLVPDPLLPADTVAAGADESNAFWLTVRVGPHARPGDHPIIVTVVADGRREHQLKATVTVYPLTAPVRKGFPVSTYLYADPIADFYRVDLFGDRFWKLLRSYLTDYTEHGCDAMLVPLMTPVMDGVKRPTQLLGIRPDNGGYAFDFSLVHHWIELARSAGVTTFEWSHLFSQWGVHHPARAYLGHGETEELLWPGDTDAMDPVYRDFLAALLPALHRFLEVEGILADSYLHLSDEPALGDIDRYRRARGLVRDLAPWARVLEAVSDLEFGRRRLIDMPVPLIETAPSFVDAGIDSWAYFCTGPRGSHANRFLDTPLASVRMFGRLLHRNGASGHLHWGYNYWYEGGTRTLIDPYTVADAGRWPTLPAGDPFVVYPGADGPIDSTRWEVFAEGLQELALLRTSPDELTRPLLEGINGYADFPREVDRIIRTRKMLLENLTR